MNEVMSRHSAQSVRLEAQCSSAGRRWQELPGMPPSPPARPAGTEPGVPAPCGVWETLELERDEGELQGRKSLGGCRGDDSFKCSERCGLVAAFLHGPDLLHSWVS